MANSQVFRVPIFGVSLEKIANKYKVILFEFSGTENLNKDLNTRMV